MIEPFAGSTRTLASLHNYSPLFQIRMGIGGAHTMNGAWAIHQRGAWVDLLAHYPASSNAGLDFIPALRTARNALNRLRLPAGELDACLQGFKEAAPLLRIGQKEGIGKLVPTANVSARDLLNYGWEMAGLQMGARYYFVNERWGVPEQAQPIFETVTDEVQSLYPFFKNGETATRIPNYPEAMFRLQHVSRIYNFVGQGRNPQLKTYMGPNSSAVLFLKRCWLRADLFNWQVRTLWIEGRSDVLTELIESIQREDSPLGAATAIRFLSKLSREQLRALPNASERMARMAEQLPQPSRLYAQAVWEKKFSGKSMLEQAQALERLYWQNPDSQMEDWVFLLYAKAGAFDAARRFYLESRENFIDSVRVSSAVGTYAYVTGYLKNDADLRQKAMADSASASYDDMLLGIWERAIQDDRNGLQLWVDELIERYESNAGPEGVGRKIKRFLPLLPALGDTNHPQHRTALQYFRDYPGAIFTRWIWIEKFKMSKEEAIEFLGGRQADGIRPVLVCYLEGDAEKTRAAADAFMKRDDARLEQCILAQFLSRKLAQDSKEPAVPDLKPARATSARAAVLARIAEKQK